ncbi:hypothetical protein ABEG18_05445 [Alsobacter sp. KACC 23698]|uniref:Uncharacterized protein n=1 Tax=Alsobacter sp. KACC 23698 TaxID=3149229 RepID=A0AAU7JJ34_9HYPH
MSACFGSASDCCDACWTGRLRCRDGNDRVTPEGGLPQVDREFYVMQGEINSTQRFGSQGDQEMDFDKLVSEKPEYFLPI